jgi:hypothetical protein
VPSSLDIRSHFCAFVEKIPKNTLLIFVAIGSCKLLGMGQYDKFYDKNDEPLININTFDSHHQGWKGDKDCTIQINYKNFYEFNGQKELKCVIISPGSTVSGVSNCFSV